MQALSTSSASRLVRQIELAASGMDGVKLASPGRVEDAVADDRSPCSGERNRPLAGSGLTIECKQLTGLKREVGARSHRAHLVPTAATEGKRSRPLRREAGEPAAACVQPLCWPANSDCGQAPNPRHSNKKDVGSE